MEMSNSVGYRYLTTLRDRGIIKYNGKDTLSVKGQETMKTAFRRVAIVGSIVCGSPETTDRRYKVTLPFPRSGLTAIAICFARLVIQ